MYWMNRAITQWQWSNWCRQDRHRQRSQVWIVVFQTQSEANASFDAVYAASGYTDGCGGVVTAELVSAVVSGSKCSWSILYTFKAKDECNELQWTKLYTRWRRIKSAPAELHLAITGRNACLPTQSEADDSFDAVLAASGYSDGCGGVVTAELVSAVVGGDKCSWSILYI